MLYPTHLHSVGESEGSRKKHQDSGQCSQERDATSSQKILTNYVNESPLV
jgi:hypothetical protein